MEKPQLHIEKPCLEDWSKMSPKQMGRHCQLCDKTVVDFTQMSPEEISNYLTKKSKERICGRILSSTHLHEEKTSKNQRWFNRLYHRIENGVRFKPVRMSLLGTLSLLMLLTGCEHEAKTKQVPLNETKVSKPESTLDRDSLERQKDEPLMGNVKRPTQADTIQLKKGFIAPPPIPPILGEIIEIEPSKNMTGDFIGPESSCDSMETTIGEVNPSIIVGKIIMTDKKSPKRDTLK
jgi:hypothetical protein